jgi:uncharacterized protein YyaL (SSP411 family)
MIPASNSMLAITLNTLGIYFGKAEWIVRSREMLQTVKNEMIGYGPGYSNWMNLALHDLFPSFELFVTGTNALEKAREITSTFYPELLVAAAEKESEIPLFESRILVNETFFYLCRQSVCDRPTDDIEEIKFALRSTCRS